MCVFVCILALTAGLYNVVQLCRANDSLKSGVRPNRCTTQNDNDGDKIKILKTLRKCESFASFIVLLSHLFVNQTYLK